jgi:hypothetical protein
VLFDKGASLADSRQGLARQAEYHGSYDKIEQSGMFKDGKVDVISGQHAGPDDACVSAATGRALAPVR